jgi:hypothetical protein
MIASYTPALTAVPLPAVQPAPGATDPRVLILLDPETARPQVLSHVEATGQKPSLVVLLWVVTPSELLTWGALAAEPAADRTSAMLAALGERMAAARRRLAPLQWACQSAGIPVQIQIAHGTVAESLVKTARACRIDRVIIPAQDGAVRGHPARPLIDALARQLECAVELVSSTPG